MKITKPLFLIVLCSTVLQLSSFAQTWTPMPFTTNTPGESFTICDGNQTVTIEDDFENTNSTGSVGMSGTNNTGSFSLSQAMKMRINDPESIGSNNGDDIRVRAVGPNSSWTPFGTEATAENNRIRLLLVDPIERSYGITNSASTIFNFTKVDNGGGGVFVYYDEEECALLPVELVRFTAETIGNLAVWLSWDTATELNNEHFVIQRSDDGKNWKDLSVIPGHATSQEQQFYNYTDNQPLPGVNYYRLKQMDFDGGFDYSHIVSVDLRSLQDLTSLSLYPNPTKGSVTLSLQSDFVGDASLAIFDLMGNQVSSQILSLEGGAFNTNVGISDLPAGVYLVDVTAGNEKWQERLVVE